LRAALLFALLFGLLEAAEIAALRHVPHVQSAHKVSLHIFWAAPFVHVVANLGAAAAGLALSRLGLAVPHGLIIGGFAFIGLIGVTAYSTFLGEISCLLLSAGLAVQIARLYQRHGSPGRLGRVTAYLGVLAAAPIVFAAAWDSFAASRGTPGITPPLSRPNVLLIVLDTVRADRLSTYGSRQSRTPTIDRVAREGVLFERAYSASSWTLPSHASILTGLAPSSHGAQTFSTVLAAEHTQLQEVFRAQGYSTGAFAANSAFFVPELGFGRGFDVFDAYSPRSLIARTTFGIRLRPLLRRVDIDADAFRRAPDVSARFEQWIRTAAARPFFAVINFMDAHEPYVAADGSRPSLRVWDRQRWGQENNSALLEHAYGVAVAGIDQQLGRLFGRLRPEPWWDNTLVIITSDHGEAIADGTFDHGSDLTGEQIHVPLIMRFPARLPSGERVSVPVSLTDVPATVQDVTGVTSRRLPGRSLTRWLSDAGFDLDDSAVLAEVADPDEKIGGKSRRSIIAGDFQYIQDLPGGRERLFNIVTDPAGLEDRAADTAQRKTLDHLRALLPARTAGSSSAPK
jgi:arylsulfatase A-like enzyme